MIPFTYSDTLQFREIVQEVKFRAEAHNVRPPVLSFIGTVKLHGCNSSVVQDIKTRTMYAQSRNTVITPVDDHMGFAKFVKQQTDCFNLLFMAARVVFGISQLTEADSLVIYGEWCGQGIMKGVAVSQVPKMFVIFGIRVIRGEEKGEWFTPSQVNDVYVSILTDDDLELNQVFCAYSFKTYTIDIDFDQPELARDLMVEMVKEVEAECPVGKCFGVSGVGEGIVFKCVEWINGEPLFRIDDLMFKVKGEKHAETKTKEKISVDVEKVNSTNALLEMVLTPHRLEKMIYKMVEMGDPVTVESTGIFLKYIGQDVMKEEGDVIDKSGLDRKSVTGPLNKKARDWYMNYLDSVIFNAG